MRCGARVQALTSRTLGIIYYRSTGGGTVHVGIHVVCGAWRDHADDVTRRVVVCLSSGIVRPIAFRWEYTFGRVLPSKFGPVDRVCFLATVPANAPAIRSPSP